MKSGFKDWIKIIESSGSEVEEDGKGFKVTGDVILINCGLTRIPSGLFEVTGTLDISLNPIESFECTLKVGRLICMGTKPISIRGIDFSINDMNADQISESDFFIKGYKISDIKKAKFEPLEKRLPELKGMFE